MWAGFHTDHKPGNGEGNKAARPERDNRDTVVDIPVETAEQVYC